MRFPKLPIRRDAHEPDAVPDAPQDPAAQTSASPHGSSTGYREVPMPNLSPPPLTSELTKSIRFTISQPQGYYFEQVETFVEQVSDALAYYEQAEFVWRKHVYDMQVEMDQLAYDSQRLRSEIELFKVQGSPLVNPDGTFVTESQQASHEAMAAELQRLTAALAQTEAALATREADVARLQDLASEKDAEIAALRQWGEQVAAESQSWQAQVADLLAAAQQQAPAPDEHAAAPAEEPVAVPAEELSEEADAAPLQMQQPEALPTVETQVAPEVAPDLDTAAPVDSFYAPEPDPAAAVTDVPAPEAVHESASAHEQVPVTDEYPEPGTYPEAVEGLPVAESEHPGYDAAATPTNDGYSPEQEDPIADPAMEPAPDDAPGEPDTGYEAAAGESVADEAAPVESPAPTTPPVADLDPAEESGEGAADAPVTEYPEHAEPEAQDTPEPHAETEPYSDAQYGTAEHDPYAEFDRALSEEPVGESIPVVPVDSELPEGIDLPGTGEAVITYPPAAPDIPLDTRGVPMEVWAPELDPKIRSAIARERAPKTEDAPEEGPGETLAS